MDKQNPSSDTSANGILILNVVCANLIVTNSYSPGACMLVHTFNLRTLEAEVGRSLWVWSQSEQKNQCQESQGCYTEKKKRKERRDGSAVENTNCSCQRAGILGRTLSGSQSLTMYSLTKSHLGRLLHSCRLTVTWWKSNISCLMKGEKKRLCWHGSAHNFNPCTWEAEDSLVYMESSRKFRET